MLSSSCALFVYQKARKVQHCRTIVLNCLIPWIERTHGTIEDNCSTMSGFAARKVQNAKSAKLELS